jgi:hypothetical protein
MPRETCPPAKPVEFRLLRNTAFKQKREKKVTADISILDFGLPILDSKKRQEFY